MLRVLPLVGKWPIVEKLKKAIKNHHNQYFITTQNIEISFKLVLLMMFLLIDISLPQNSSFHFFPSKTLTCVSIINRNPQKTNQTKNFSFSQHLFDLIKFLFVLGKHPIIKTNHLAVPKLKLQISRKTLIESIMLSCLGGD